MAVDVPGTPVRIESAGGGGFDSYLSHAGGGPATGVVLISGIFGVGEELKKMADDLAARGFTVSAPDMFWRTDPGPLTNDAAGRQRSAERSQPRREVIERGIQDVADTISYLKGRPECNGKVGVIGFCFGGAYALLGPARLGCDAGISFHGTNLELWFDDLEKIRCPLSLHWGDQDFAAPPEVIEQFRAAVATMDNAEMHVYPGVKHGYSSPDSVDAYDAAATDHSWQRARAILQSL